MEIKYKPTKPKKEKPFKAPKAEKAAKPMSFGSAQSVKIDKPKKVKEPKPAKATKPEKAVSFTPTKVEKATDFKASGKLPKSVNPKVVAIALSVVAVVAVLVAASILIPDSDDNTAGTLQSIELVSAPDKLEYVVGEESNWYGLKVKASLDGGVSAILEAKDCTITGFDSSTPAEEQTITVAYKGMTTTFSITIAEKREEVKPFDKCNGLSFKTMPKTEYKVGDWLNVNDGVLIVHYESGDTKEIPMLREYVYDFTSEAPGEYTLRVMYEEDGFLATCTYTITVE